MSTADQPDERCRTQIRQQELVSRLGERALETEPEEFEQLLQAVGDAVCDGIDTDRSAVIEYQPEHAHEDRAVVRAGAGWPRDIVGERVAAGDRSWVGQVLRSTEPVVDDGMSDTELVGADAVTSGLCIAIGPPETPWGVLGAYETDHREFTDDERAFLQNVAHILGLAATIDRERHNRITAQTRTTQLARNSQDGIILTDKSGQPTLVNDPATAVLGGKRTIRSVIEDDAWTVTDGHGEPVTGQTPLEDVLTADSTESTREITIEPPADDPRTLTVSASVVDGDEPKDDTGGGIVVLEDVTEQRERERELMKYETIVETVTDGIYLVDDEYQFTAVNEAYVELTGYSREELIGADCALVVGEEVSNQAAEYSSQLVESGGSARIEAPVLTADGEAVLAESKFTALSSPDGSFQGTVGVVRDIRERKARERALEESERRYRTLLDHFPNGIVALFDEDRQYTVAGGDRFGKFGIDPEDVPGTALSELGCEKLVSVLGPAFDDALAGNKSSFELSHNGYDWLVYTVPVRDDTGEVFAGMLMVQDITEQKESRRQLEASNERLEQFASAVSHDLQEPLRMISSYLKLIDKRYGDVLDADGQEYLAYAVDGADRMRTMIDDLLTYSRIETRGKSFETVDCEQVFEEALTDLTVAIEESNAEITVGSLPCVSGDRSQLRQLFENLLCNAITYTDQERPQIQVDATHEDDEYVISVADNGIGMDPSDTEKVFDIFNRLHSVDEYTGTGIGLALCKRIVERHGGEIWIDSEPGVGSTVFLTLPAEEDDG